MGAGQRPPEEEAAATLGKSHPGPLPFGPVGHVPSPRAAGASLGAAGSCWALPPCPAEQLREEDAAMACQAGHSPRTVRPRGSLPGAGQGGATLTVGPGGKEAGRQPGSMTGPWPSLRGRLCRRAHSTAPGLARVPAPPSHR